jgi:hypothetical protein
MTARLGPQQLYLLANMASPFSLLIVADNTSRSLEKRGLIGPHSLKRDGGFYGVTPSGLRALADAMERGELEPLLDPRFQAARTRLYLDQRAESKG